MHECVGGLQLKLAAVLYADFYCDEQITVWDQVDVLTAVEQ